MDQPPPPERKKLTPAVIGSAPDSVPAVAEIPSDHPIWELIAELQVQVESLRADNARLTAESDPGIVKARLLKPYANRVFRFLVGYTTVVFAIIIAHGAKAYGFTLPESVLGILAGTSFIAIAGLIGAIISGLFSK